MRYTVYLDTSVLGALTDSELPERAAATRRLLSLVRSGSLIGYLSAVVIEELAAAPEIVRARIDAELKTLPLDVIEETSECIALAKAYMREGLFPTRYANDARHVAIAAVGGMDALVSWNFRHMVNLEKRRQIAGVNLIEGYRPLAIVSPLEIPYGP